MAGSAFLRKNKKQHGVKNAISKKMDSDIDVAVGDLIEQLRTEYPNLSFEHERKMHLARIISDLSQQFPRYAKNFSSVMKESFIKPDGGFLYASRKGAEGRKLILVTEVKRQGTNDKRLHEGLPKQAKGNAIERLGKNLVGIRAIFKNEDIIPFICFGSGCDFQGGSSIVDRVVTMNEFFPLNEIFVRKNYLPFEPVSMFFRHGDWPVEEMATIMHDVATLSIKHHFGQ